MYAQSTAVRHEDRRSPAPFHDDSLARLHSLATTKRYRRHQEICSEEQPADYFYRVRSGTVRQCVTRADGRRQIIDLLLAGDVFGLTARGGYDFSAEATETDTLVSIYPRRRIEALAENNADIGRVLNEMLRDSLSRLRSQLLILGRITAREKVGSFLLVMADRLSDGPAHKVVLPISRYDIADYLAVSVETVSRSLTDLKHCGAIALPGTRRVRIIDRHALEEIPGH